MPAFTTIMIIMIYLFFKLKKCGQILLLAVKIKQYGSQNLLWNTKTFLYKYMHYNDFHHKHDNPSLRTEKTPWGRAKAMIHLRVYL